MKLSTDGERTVLSEGTVKDSTLPGQVADKDSTVPVMVMVVDTQEEQD